MGKQVKTPRFYVDMPTFLHATGDLHWADSERGKSLLYMNPSNPYVRPEAPETNWLFKIGNFNNTPKTSFPINFVALLNHNLASDDNGFKIKGIHNTGMGTQYWPTLTTSTNYKANILNANRSNTELSLAYNGTSIFELNNTNNALDEYWNFFGIEYSNDDTNNDTTDFDTNVPHQLGSMVVGKYWDAPNSPDMSLTMSRRFDGIKRQKTIGGKTLANIYYDGPTEWTMNHPDEGVYKYPPFELDYTRADFYSEIGFNARAKSGLGRKGLRSWKLTFSYISEDNMWMKNETSNTIIADDTDFANTNPNPMLSDDSFNFVWNCTLGGTLPFIFQPDNTNRNPDNFSICTFRENTLSVTQQAHNVYKLSITIDEVA
jgi:hypothetical protein